MAELARPALEAMPELSAPTPDDRRLLDCCLEGDPAAWEEFVRRHHPLLEGAVRFTFHRCLSRVPREDVENVVQDLYARLYEHDYRRLRSYEGRCPLAMWLKSLAVRHALNTIRDEKRRGRYGGAAAEDLRFRSDDDRESPSPEEREQAFRLGGLIDRLGPLQRTALKMFYYDGLAYRQIAAALGISIQTVGSLISRARDRLRTLMAETE